MANFRGLLPDSVLLRTTKGLAGQAFTGRETRSFAESWDGTGVNTELIDPQALRRSWLGDELVRDLSGAIALHEAWLAANAPKQHRQTAVAAG
jgi:asparagine synthase (glutamine-hydrolysing)